MTFNLTTEEKQELLAGRNRQQAERMHDLIEQPVEEVTLEYRYKAKTAKYPASILIYFIHRYITNRWIDKCRSNTLWLTSRPGHRDESIQMHISSREKFMIYESLSKLIEDEKLTGSSEEFIQDLESAAKKYSIHL